MCSSGVFVAVCVSGGGKRQSTKSPLVSHQFAENEASVGRFVLSALLTWWAPILEYFAFTLQDRPPCNKREGGFWDRLIMAHTESTHPASIEENPKLQSRLPFSVPRNATKFCGTPVFLGISYKSLSLYWIALLIGKQSHTWLLYIYFVILIGSDKFSLRHRKRVSKFTSVTLWEAKSVFIRRWR